jgi:hypothetical protein
MDAAAGDAVSNSASPDTDMEVVLVKGEQPGPALWKVSSGSHVLWILGEVTPLPRKVKWRSKQFESLLENAQEVMLHDASQVFRGRQAAAVSQAAKLPDERSLSDVVSPELRARIQAVAQLYGVDGSLEGLSPSVVGTRFANASLKTLDLRVVSLQSSVEALARKSGVGIIYYSTPASDLTFEQRVRMIEDNVLATCPLERVIDVLEDGGTGLSRLANAWSIGDIDALRILVPEFGLFTSGFRSQGCSIAEHAGVPSTDPYVLKRTTTWVAEAERALGENESTLAVVPIPELFAADGYLAALRAKGYEVVEPQ